MFLTFQKQITDLREQLARGRKVFKHNKRIKLVSFHFIHSFIPNKINRKKITGKITKNVIDSNLLID
jgi:hypothetical protein